MNSSSTPSLLSVSFTHVTEAGVVGAVAERIAQSRYDQPLTVFTPNVEQLIQARKDRRFLAHLHAADIRIPDSVGLVWADWWRAALFGQAWKIHQRLTGVDVAEKLMAEAATHGWKVVIIGGTDNAASQAADRLKKRFHGLQIWGVEVGEIKVDRENMTYKTNKSYMSYLFQINSLRPDLLYVGLGAPKQEWWVMTHRDQLQAQAVMVVGGAVDMWAGEVSRAPQWLQRIGLEWLYRLIQEPWRLGRQTRLLQFAWLTLTGRT